MYTLIPVEVRNSPLKGDFQMSAHEYCVNSLLLTFLENIKFLLVTHTRIVLMAVVQSSSRSEST